VYLEKDHIHIHKPADLPSHLQAPAPGVELTPQCGNFGSQRVFIPWDSALRRNAAHPSPTVNQNQRNPARNTGDVMLPELYQGETGDVEFGDSEMGDAEIEAGDPQETIGDIVDAHEMGEPDPIAISESGSPLGFIKRHKMGVALGLTGLAAGVYGANRAVHAYKNMKRRKAKRAKATKKNSWAARRWPFIHVDNGRVQISPLSETANGMSPFQLAQVLEMALSRSPSNPIYKSTTVSGPTTVMTASITDVQASNPVQTNFCFPYFILEMAASVLNAQPAGLASLSAVGVPTEFNGSVVLTAQSNLVLSIGDVNKRLAVAMFPWATISTGPQPLMGLIGPTASSASQSLTITISGLPTGTIINLILPGNTHPTIDMIRHWIKTGESISHGAVAISRSPLLGSV
jgi:hypothetical protein